MQICARNKTRNMLFYEFFIALVGFRARFAIGFALFTFMSRYSNVGSQTVCDILSARRCLISDTGILLFAVCNVRLFVDVDILLLVSNWRALQNRKSDLFDCKTVPARYQLAHKLIVNYDIN